MHVFLTSPGGRYKLMVQREGKLVGMERGVEGHFWTSGPPSDPPTPSSRPYRLAMQSNGNLVVYDAADHPVWATWEHRLVPQEPGRYELHMQADRNICIYHLGGEGGDGGTLVWQSGTAVEKKKEAPSSSRSVFVGNLPYDATEEQLVEIFREVGPVVSFRLVYDKDTGRPKGYAFCEYASSAVAESAMRNLNGREFNGRSLRVDYAGNREVAAFYIDTCGGGGAAIYLLASRGLRTMGAARLFDPPLSRCLR